MRISRYFDMLTTSFNIMREGMDPEQYGKFRHTLTPASGFQSAQYRLIEFASTELIAYPLLFGGASIILILLLKKYFLMEYL